jgi:peptidyl-tRNA hydrolase, PTH1 family
MRLIVGIGNPGREYEHTRHNLGFAVVDQLASRHATPWQSQRKWRCETADWPQAPGGRALLMKPTTFVNASGEAVQAVCSFYQIALTDILIVVDDIHLTTGHLRLRAEGSAGGHNGLKDIEARLGRAYARLRLGCGPPPPGFDQVGFVLGRFPPQEQPLAEAMVGRAGAAVSCWLSEGFLAANRFNGGPPQPPQPRPPRPEKPPPALRLDPPA